jgi:sugar lactone lactonase YvrE
MQNIAPAPIVSVRCELAENPIWDARRERFYWTDIPADKIHSCGPGGQDLKTYQTGASVGGFTLQKDGSLLLFRVNDFCVYDLEKGVLSSVPVSMEGARRFNDVIAAPDGSVLAGTIGKTADSGGLYHFTPSGHARKLFSGTGCSNGMGFSPDLRTFYWTCSTTRKIFSFVWMPEGPDVDSKKVFYDVPEGEGIPDGMTVDTRGHIWTARWDGYRVLELDPSGCKVQEIRYPRGRVSSVCFGGSEYDILFATVAETEGESAPLMEQSIYTCRPGFTGCPEFFSDLDPGSFSGISLP